MTGHNKLKQLPDIYEGGYLRSSAAAANTSNIPGRIEKPGVSNPSSVPLAYVKQSGGSHLLLVGLGHKGLPQELFESVRYHLDITGQGIPLETCTAIGAVPAVLAALVGINQ